MTHPPIIFVDENDKPIGSGSMQEARKNGIRHRVVRIVIQNSKGEFLLQKRGSRPDMLYPGLWDYSAAGHVDDGEDYLDAAKRELKEELNVEAILEPIDHRYGEHTSEEGETVKRFYTTYIAKYDETPTDLQEGEVEEVKWFSLKAINRLLENNPDSATFGIKFFFKELFKT
jgi:isopentenyldiphosphate isomerase